MNLFRNKALIILFSSLTLVGTFHISMSLFPLSDFPTKQKKTASTTNQYVWSLPLGMQKDHIDSVITSMRSTLFVHRKMSRHRYKFRLL